MPSQHRRKLPADHPLTAPGYSARRATMARQIGLGAPCRYRTGFAGNWTWAGGGSTGVCGGTVLRTIPRQSDGRPPSLPQGDFRAVVAFYPALCSDQREPASWTSDIPLLVLIGAADVWTPAAPCRSFIAGAVARGSPIEMQIYPGAYHLFDAPNLPIRELPQFQTPAGVVPIAGTDPAAHQDAFARVPKFLARFFGN